MPRHFAFELAILVILCVIGIFLFPAGTGPYSAVHGPVSALQSLRTRARLRWAMALAALNLVLIHLRLTVGWKCWPASSRFEPFELLHSCSILRC